MDLASRAYELRRRLDERSIRDISWSDGDSSPARSEQENSIVSDLKSLFHDRLVESSIEAKVENTTYFNHSAIPDFVLTWGKSKKTRKVFLRGSYAAIVASSSDMRADADDPIFLSLDKGMDFDLSGLSYSREQIVDSASSKPSSLITDIEAFSAATSPAPEATPAGDEFPLNRLVRANFVRGARGLFDDRRVELFVSNAGSTDQLSLMEEVSNSFNENVSEQFQRVAALIDMSRSTVLQNLDELHLMRGRLTAEEVRSILPWVMSNATAEPQAPFWRTLGGLLDLELLESESDSLQNVDLTNLIEANVSSFAATRAYSGYAADESSSSDRVDWRMQGSTLVRRQGASALKYACLGTRLKQTGKFSGPRWSDVYEMVSTLPLVAARVHGVVESIRVETRGEGEINSYLARAIPDDERGEYFLDELSLLLRGASPEGEDRGATVDFERRMVIATGLTTLDELSRIAGLFRELSPELAENGDGAPAQ